MAAHTAEKNIVAGVVGEIMRGNSQGILVNGDLTSATAAKAAVDADVAKLHVSERLAGIGVKKAIDLADNFVPGFTAGSSVAAISGAQSPTPQGRRLLL